MTEEELKKRIASLRKTIEDPYVIEDIKDEIIEQIEFLQKLYNALYFY